MSANRITRGGAMLAALLLAVLALAGCGGGSSSSTAGSSTAATTTSGAGASTKDVAASPSADATLLDRVLGRQKAAVAAYVQVIPGLPTKLSHMATYFRTQEQEHIDGTIRALRNLYEPAEPAAETIDVGEPKTARERLEFLYEMEGGTIDKELDAISKLEASLPRTILASTVANQAQHLSLLRRELGAGPLASIPRAFEDGTVPPPDK
jgi:hypothetical protein